MKTLGLALALSALMALPAQAKRSWRSVPESIRTAVDATLTSVGAKASAPVVAGAIRSIAAHGEDALPWLAKVAPAQDGAALRVALRGMIAIDARTGRQTAVDIIDGRSAKRANIALGIGLDVGMKFASYRLIGLLMKHRGGELTAALAPLCALKKPYGIRVVKRALDRLQLKMLKVAPRCLQHYGNDGYELATAMTQHANPLVAKYGVEALVAVTASDVERFGAQTTAALSPMLRISDRRLRREVALNLAKLGSKPAVNALMNVAMRGQRSHSRTAIVALAQVSPLPVGALKRLLLRGPTYDAAPVVKQLAKRQTPEARALILDAISAASYVTWWDDAVDGFIGQGPPAFQAAVAWMRNNPDRGRNVVLALKRHPRKAAPYLMALATSLPVVTRFDEVRQGVLEVIAMGQPAGWPKAVATVAANNKLSIGSRRAALVALGKAKGSTVAMDAAKAATASKHPDVQDAGRMALALLGDRAAAEATIALLRKTPATRWKPVWLDTLAVFPDIDADMLLTTRFPGASNAVQSRLLKLLHVGKRQRGIAHLMEVAVMRDHPLRGRALALLGHRSR